MCHTQKVMLTSCGWNVTPRAIIKSVFRKGRRTGPGIDAWKIFPGPLARISLQIAWAETLITANRLDKGIVLCWNRLYCYYIASPPETAMKLAAFLSCSIWTAKSHFNPIFYCFDQWRWRDWPLIPTRPPVVQQSHIRTRTTITQGCGWLFRINTGTNSHHLDSSSSDARVTF